MTLIQFLIPALPRIRCLLFVTAALGAVLHGAATAVPGKGATAARLQAREKAWSELKELLRFVQRPNNATITELARQFDFDFTVERCHDTLPSNGWCEYEAQTRRPMASEFVSLGFGHDKKTGLPSGIIIWGPRANHSICFRPTDIEKLLGSGKETLPPIVHYVPDGNKPPLYTRISYPNLPGGGPTLYASAMYLNGCLVHITMEF